MWSCVSDGRGGREREEHPKTWICKEGKVRLRKNAHIKLAFQAWNNVREDRPVVWRCRPALLDQLAIFLRTVRRDSWSLTTDHTSLNNGEKMEVWTVVVRVAATENLPENNAEAD